jgi:hypothetical protein
VKVGLLDACDDRQLFGIDLWPKQREILGKVEQGPRMHVWALGRRSSKTTSKAIVGLWSCLLRPELLEFLRPGERGYAVGVATNLRQARLLVSAALSIVERSPLLAPMVESKTDDAILFTNGTAFTAFPCTSRGGRGFPIFALLLDEFAHFLDDTEGPQVADRVWRALVPSTAQFGELARVVVGSTPWGSQGLFAELYQRASSGELPDAHAYQAASADMNPTLSADFLAGERLLLGEEGFAGEYAADFIGSGASYLDPERLEEAFADRTELPAEYACQWICGLDPAFSSDPFGLAIVGRDPLDRQRLLLGVARSWKPLRRPESFGERRDIEDALLDEVAELCLAYKARAVTDQHLSRSVVDYLRRRGVRVRTVPMTATSKTAAFGALRGRLNLSALELYRAPGLEAELRRLRARYTAGTAAVVNPRVGGSHGDIAQALALAVYEHDLVGVTPSRATMGRGTGRIPVAGRLVPVGQSNGFDRLSVLTGLQVTDGTRGQL